MLRKISTYIIHQGKLDKIDELSIEIEESNKEDYKKYLELHWKMSHYYNNKDSENIMIDCFGDGEYYYLAKWQEDYQYDKETYTQEVNDYWNDRDADMWKPDEGMDEWEEKYEKGVE